MLIEFRVSNFRSFRERQVFSMVAGNMAEHRDSNTFDPHLEAFGERLLRSSAIYGANAAGKTNLLRALQYMQALVLNSSNPLMGIIHFPFKFSSESRNSPGEFEVTFVQNGMRYEYGFVVGQNRVEREWLTEFVHARGRMLFERTLDAKSGNYNWQFSRFLKGKRAQWSELTRPNMLFLSTATQWNSQQLKAVFDWFQHRLVVIAGESKLNGFLTLNLLDEPNGKEELLSFMQEADFGITDLQIKREPLPGGAGHLVLQGSAIIEQKPGQNPNVVTVTLSHDSDDEQYSTLDLIEESSGTQNFFKSAGAWINVFKNGEVLLIDEVEASFHPLLVRFLVKRFHSEKNNGKNSQLIFTTQSTDLLDADMLRRDQVWFVEKDRKGGSRLYPLTDFKPRNNEAIESWYLRGRYGALPVINPSRD